MIEAVHLCCRQMKVRMIWRREHSCWRSTLWRYRCTLHRRTTRSLKRCMNSHYILSPQSHTLLSWVSYEVGTLSLTVLLCTERGNVTAIFYWGGAHFRSQAWYQLLEYVFDKLPELVQANAWIVPWIVSWVTSSKSFFSSSFMISSHFTEYCH